MPRPLLPPRGLYISSYLLFNPQMKPAVRETLMRLMALAWWQKEHHQTPPLSIFELARLTHKSPRTIHGHLAILRDELAALRLQPAGDGLYVIAFHDWVFEPGWSGPPGCSILQKPDQEEEDVNSSSCTVEIPPPDDQHAPAREAPANPAERGGLSRFLHRKLLDMGLFPRLLGEVAASGWGEYELRALMAWAQEDNPEKPAALFMSRLRHGARPPKRYYQPPCPRCGQRGQHDPECPQRYKESLAHFRVEERD